MAAFDAAVPNPSSDPNWLGWSRSRVQTPEPDRSGEILGKTIGKAIEGGGQIVSDVAEKQFQSGAEDILRGQIDTLQGIQNSSLMQPKDPDAEASPDEVKRAEGVANTLSSARQNGAISSTYYYGQLDKYASDMRSRFPMFTNQIDKGVAKATGVTHTANELYQSTLKDINSFLTKKDERETKAVNEAFKVWGAPGVKGTYQRYMDNKIPENLKALEDLTSNVQARQWDIKRLNDEITTSKELGQDQTRLSRRAHQAEVNNFIAVHASEVAEKLLPSGMKNLGDLEYAINNPGKYSATEMQQVTLAHDNVEIALRKRLEAEANRPIVQMTNPQTGKMELWSRAQLDPEYQTTIDRGLKIWKAQGDYLKDGNHGAAAFIGNQTKAAEADVTHQLIKDETGVGNFALWSKTLKDMGMPDYVIKGMSDSVKDVMSGKLKDLVMSTNGRSWVPKGKVLDDGTKPAVSLQTDIDNFVNKYGIKAPKVFNKFVDDVGNIVDPKIPDNNKVAKILYLTDPSNRDVLRNWHREGLQPDGKFDANPNRYNVYSALFSPEVTSEVRRLSSVPAYQKFDLWNKYKGNSTNLLDGLIGDSVRDLNAYDLKSPGDFTYDDEKSNFIYRGASGVGTQVAQESPYTREVNSRITISHINMGLDRMKEIAKAEGSDPNAYIYNSLSAMGYRFEDHPKTAGGALINSIVATRLAEKKTLEEQRRKAIELGTKK